jgi:hypothetical protein
MFAVPASTAVYGSPMIAFEAEDTDVANGEVKRGRTEHFTPAVSKGAEY